MRAPRRKHWFVSLHREAETWAYAGPRSSCEATAIDEYAAGCGEPGRFTYWMAPGHRSRKNREDDCDPEEHEFTVEMGAVEQREAVFSART
jgi:hypothetical protein